jgi:uncharacterized protein YceH (UPF0502 family)
MKKFAQNKFCNMSNFEHIVALCMIKTGSPTDEELRARADRLARDFWIPAALIFLV